MVKISKEDKLQLKEFEEKYSMEEIKKIRGFLFEGYSIKEATRKAAR